MAKKEIYEKTVEIANGYKRILADYKSLIARIEDDRHTLESYVDVDHVLGIYKRVVTGMERVVDKANIAVIESR